MIQTVIKILSILTIVAQFLVILAPFILMFGWKNKLAGWLKDKASAFIFLVAFVATSGSLFFSEIAGFDPCHLCWFQRIFMYPLVVLYGVALIRKEKIVNKYASPLVLAGWLIALYHNYIYNQAVSLTSCTANGHASCIIPYFTEFGYISIPLMSLTAFTLIGVILLFSQPMNAKS